MGSQVGLSSARVGLKSVILLVCALLATSLVWAQSSAVPTPQPVAGAAQPATSTASATTSDPASAAQTQEQTHQLRTAAEIEAAAKAGPIDPEASAAGPMPAVEKHGIAINGTIPPKDDVSLIGQRNIGNGVNFYSIDREIALGRQLSQEVEMSARIVNDPVISEYINRIGQSLVRHSDARVPFTIKVLYNDEVNAFALPGGFFYVDSGLIIAADNEAELAGVMAHEIAHVAARHATKNMTKGQIFNMASVPLIFIGGPAAYAISEVVGIAAPLSILKFSRDAEREADALGLQYDYATGYDPGAFVEFFEKLNVEGKKKQSLVAKAFATHPMNADRIKAAQDEIRKYLPDRDEYIVDTSEFDEVKARLIMLENTRRLHANKNGGGGPVLLRRTADSGNSGTGNPTDDKDDGRPTLKHGTAN